MSYDELWSFRLGNFRIALACTYDPDEDGSWDETGETQQKLQDGTWSAYVFRVTVSAHGHTLGTDYLGGSIYEDPRTFRDHIGSRGKWGSYFTDMVHAAIQEARKELRQLQTIRVRANA